MKDVKLFWIHIMSFENWLLRQNGKWTFYQQVIEMIKSLTVQKLIDRNILGDRAKNFEKEKMTR